MKKVLQRIRSKPHHVRQRIVVVCLLIATPILLVAGVLSFLYGRSHDKASTPGVWTGLLQTFSGSAKDLSKGVSSQPNFMIESDNI